MKPALIWSTSCLVLGVAAWRYVRARRARQAALDQNFEQAQARFAATMRRFRDRKRYNLLTLDVLQRIPDEDLVQAIVDWADCKLGRAQAAGATSDVAWQALPQGFRIVCATSYAAGQVSNGGFNQYFWNTAGVQAADAVLGFERIGAAREAEIVARAIKRHAETKHWFDALKDLGTDEAFRESCRDSPLEPLDRELWALETDLDALRIRFIRTHPEQFLGKCDED